MKINAIDLSGEGRKFGVRGAYLYKNIGTSRPAYVVCREGEVIARGNITYCNLYKDVVYIPQKEML